MATNDLKGRTFLVTGGNSGIGRSTVEGLAARGGAVVVASRSAEKTAPVLDEIRRAHPGADLSFIPMDLGDLASVRRAAETFLGSGRPLDVLVNNAGLAGLRGLTKDNFEITVGTNYVGPFLLTELLLPKLREAPQGRIVNVSSQGHRQAKGIDWDALREMTATRTGIHEYAVSKLMNILHAKELAVRLAGTRVTTYSLHPGVVASDVWRQVPWPFGPIIKLFMISNEEGAKTTITCATAPELSSSTGRYFEKSAEVRPSKVSDDVALATELRRWSEKAVAPWHLK